MKSKLMIVATVIMILALGALSIWIAGQKSKSNGWIVKPIGDGKGIFVGEQRLQHKGSDPSKWSPEVRRRWERYQADIKAMDEAHEYTMIALSNRKAGRYEEAVQYYKKAYEAYPPGRPMVSIDLVETYELMEQYDNAIAVIDKMLEANHISDWGQKAAIAMKEKLWRKKESQELSTDKLGWPLRKGGGFKDVEGRWYPEIEQKNRQ